MPEADEPIDGEDQSDVGNQPETDARSEQENPEEGNLQPVQFEKGYVTVKKDVIVYQNDNKKEEKGKFTEKAIVYAEMERLSEDNYEKSWLKVIFDTEEARKSGKELLTGYVQIQDVEILKEQETDKLHQELENNSEARNYGDIKIPAVTFASVETEQTTEDGGSTSATVKSEQTPAESKEKSSAVTDQNSEAIKTIQQTDEVPSLPQVRDAEPVLYDANNWKDAPTNLKATTTPGRVTLTWSHSGAPYFGYYEVISGQAKYLGYTSGKTVTIENVSPGVHKYTVYTRKKNSSGAWEFGTRPSDVSILVNDWKTAPTNLKAVVSGATVTLTWSHTGADAYGVYEVVNGEAKFLAVSTEKKYVLSNLSSGTHYYTVSARMQFDGKWTFGNRCANVGATIEKWTTAPTNLKISAAGSEIGLSWSHPGAEAYGVYEVVDGNAVFRQVATEKKVKLIDVAPGKHTYLVYARKKNASGSWAEFGNKSSKVSATVASWTNPPTNLKVSVKYSTATLSWDYSGGAEAFGVYEKVGSSFKYLKMVTGKKAVVDNIEPGVHYFSVAPRKKNSNGKWDFGTHCALVKKTIVNWKAAPENLTVTAKGSNVHLTWTHEGAEAYGVYGIENGEAKFLKTVYDKKADLTDQAAGFREYTVSARVKNSSGSWLFGNRAASNGTWIDYWTVAPTNLKAVVSGSTVKLTWNHDGAEAFGVYEVIDGANTYQKLSTENSCMLTDVTPGKHTYLVYARKKNAEGKWAEYGSKSQKVTVSIEKWTKAPTNVKVTASGHLITVSWSHDGADGYGVYEVNGDSLTLKKVTAGKKVQIEQNAPGKHTYLVYARKKSGDGKKWEAFGSKSAKVSATVPAWAAAPVLTTVTASGCYVGLTWTHSGAEAYGIYEVTGGKTVYKAQTTSKKITLTDVTPGNHTYLIYARQKNSSGNWEYGCQSNQLSTTVEAWAAAPTNLKATASGSSVVLSWSHNGSVDAYGVYEVIDGTPKYQTHTSSKKITLTDVKPGKHTYLVYARKKNSSGNWQYGCKSATAAATVASWAAAPSNFSVSISDITITMSWSHPGGADYYGIYEVINGEPKYMTMVSGKSYTFKATDKGKHTYLVYARKKNSSGSWEFGAKSGTKAITVNDYTSNSVVYSLSSGVWTIIKYNGTASSLTIPAKVLTLPVKAIGESAFEGNTYLKTIDLPDSIITIGAKAFKNCTNLANMK